MSSYNKRKASRQNWELAAVTLRHQRIKREQIYLLTPAHCKKCEKPLSYEKRKNQFCCSSCAATFNNKKRAPPNKETKQKIKLSLQTYRDQLPKRTNQCKRCGKEFDVNSRTSKKKYCLLCLSIILKENCSKRGRKSAEKQAMTRRSQNEMLFANFCIDYFLSVETNKPLFNGWDADIIIHDIKTAVLWNGIWHYKQITRQHSVEQVQNRDRIKLTEIQKFGYVPYIIKDVGSFDPIFVEQQFKQFIGQIV